MDVSERQRADAQRDLLLAELNHRVKNTLAVVQGIAHQTFKGGEASAAARAAFEGRLHALAVAHNMLTQTNWTHAPLAKLARDTLGPRLGQQSRITIDGPVLLLDPKSALTISMALHELLTNAVKYGALSTDTGKVALTWSVDEPARLVRLDWRETGGPTVSPPNRRGFGSRLIEKILADDLDGEVSLQFLPEGVVCSLRGTLPQAEGATQ